MYTSRIAGGVSSTNREECLNREGIREDPQLSALDAMHAQHQTVLQIRTFSDP